MKPFAALRSGSVAALGEEALIARIRRWLGAAAPPPPAGPGDDCALLRPRTGTRLLATSDPVVHGIHFDDATAPAAAAAKLLRRNLSDIAAMGGTPRFAIVSWTMPPGTSIRWVETFHRALAREARTFGVTINGGDVSGCERDLAAHLTLIGEVRGRALLRTGARKGDWLYVTGTLGGSLLGRHARFAPRIDEGRWLARQNCVRCMIDVSDGLAKELRLIAPRGCRPAVAQESVPVSAAARKMAARTGRPAIEHALCDGEDFELLFAAAPGAVARSMEKRWHRRFRTGLTRIGRFVDEREPGPGEIDLSGLAGFEHLRTGAGAPGTP